MGSRRSAPRRHRPAPPRTPRRPRPPTSKQHGPMAGPSATRRSSGRAPNSATSARTAAGSTPATVPRQPACAAATAPVRGSTTNAGMQSATNTPSATPASSVTRRVRLDARDRRGIVAGAHAHDRGAVDLPRDVERPARRRPRAAAGAGSPRRCRARRPSARPCSAMSNGAALTPPARVENPCTNGGAISRRPQQRQLGRAAPASSSSIRASPCHRPQPSARSAASAACMSGGSSDANDIFLPVAGCTNAERARVQRLPPQRVRDRAHGRLARRPPVGPIGQQRAAERRHVHAHLVRAPGLEPRLDARRARERARPRASS